MWPRRFSDREDNAVLLLNRKPFDKASLSSLVGEGLQLQSDFVNDIYSKVRWGSGWCSVVWWRDIGYGAVGAGDMDSGQMMPQRCSGGRCHSNKRWTRGKEADSVRL